MIGDTALMWEMRNKQVFPIEYLLGRHQWYTQLSYARNSLILSHPIPEILHLAIFKVLTPVRFNIQKFPILPKDFISADLFTGLCGWFLSTFSKLRSILLSSRLYARPSVRIEQHVYRWTIFHEIWYEKDF